MAKVMISLPDDLLEQIDSEARRRQTSRSALFQDFARDAFSQRGERLARRMRELEGGAIDRGGNVAEQLRQSRPR